MPPALSTCLTDQYGGKWDSTRALAEAKRDGVADAIPALAIQAAASLNPIDREKLRKSITTVGMALAPNRPADAAAAWVAVMVNGLSDLPADIVSDVLNDWVRTSKFPPSVAEIRDLAEPLLAKQRRDAARLDCLARLIASGAVVSPAAQIPDREEPRPFREEDRCTPEQAAAILEEMGLSAAAAEQAKQFLGPRRMPTAADYAALGVAPEHIPTLERRAA